MKAPTDITQTDSIRESWNKMESSVSRMGFDYGVYCYTNSDRNMVGIIATRNAVAWGRHHAANGYGQYDPIAQVMQKKELFIWDFKGEKNKITRKLLNERKDYGMKFGVTVPVLNKHGVLTSWISLSINNSENKLNTLMKAPGFIEHVYDMHIKTAAHTLSKVNGIEFNLCHAVVLSQYINKVEGIAEKTGFLVCDLQKLFSRLYLSYNNFDFSYLDAQQAAGLNVKGLNDYLKANGVLKCKFSKRERDCVELIKKGLTAKQAARVLGISHRTYEWYTNEIRQKLNCTNQRELVFKLSSYRI